jgi:hypothetical protein
MISGISSSSSIMPQVSSSSSSSASSSLTSSQLETISSVLASYDSSNLSASDAQSIIESFQDAGIEPSSELESAMSDLGFDAKEVGDLGRSDAQSGMPPPPPSEEDVSSISSLLDSLLSSDEEDDTSTSSSTSDIMDYTSRILSLNDSSKEEVMNLLDKYSSEDSTYSQSETNTLLKASLSEILSDNSNYKSVSFYG